MRLRSSGLCATFVAAIAGLSLLPLAVALVPSATSLLRRVPGIGPWYAANAVPVEELRSLAPFPTAWEGRWFDVDRNYRAFEGWFGDHLGLRDLMIRSKNELDYRLFRSSSRVYFGRRSEIYAKFIVDFGLPATESLLDTPEELEQVHAGVVRYAERLAAQGVTVVFVVPMQKQYFYERRLPFHAPRLPEASRFMALYERLKADPRLQFIDVYAILEALRAENQRIFYRQDFHWTPIAAHAVAREVVHRIAALEGSSARWERPLEVTEVPFEGSEARFAARLNAPARVAEPTFVRNWTDTHPFRALDGKDGLELETDRRDDPALLPSTCLFGNSFSDGMVQAGIADFFASFTRVYRLQDLRNVPELIRGRCSYLILQTVDMQFVDWHLFTQ